MLRAVDKLAAIFVNPQERRLRALWRLILQLVAFFLVLMVAAGAASRVPGAAGAEVVNALIYLFGGLGFAWAMARFLDKRRFADFGFHLNTDWWIDFVFGLALGAALLVGVFVSMRASGWVEIRNVSATDLGVPIAVAFVIKLLSMIAVGVNEELTFRGYQLRNLAEGLSRFGPRAAITLAMVISSVVFGLLHLINELSGGAWTSPLATINLILAGLMLAVPYLLTGQLAIPIGLHITWNLFEGTVYGYPVSGIAERTHLITLTETGADAWTGGAYGPEGGLVGTAFIFLGCIVSALYVMCRKRRLDLHGPLALYTPRAAPSSASA